MRNEEENICQFVTNPNSDIRRLLYSRIPITQTSLCRTIQLFFFFVDIILESLCLGITR